MPPQKCISVARPKSTPSGGCQSATKTYLLLRILLFKHQTLKISYNSVRQIATWKYSYIVI